MADPQTMIDLYEAAEQAVLQNQSYTISGRTLTRANLDEIRRGRKEWEHKLNVAKAKSQGGSNLYSVADFTQ